MKWLSRRVVDECCSASFSAKLRTFENSSVALGSSSQRQDRFHMLQSAARTFAKPPQGTANERIGG
eukprot:2641891-Pleurochrysis_carterae.AAC.1